MSKTVSKTFRFPPQIAHQIEAGARQKKLSQTQYIVNIVIENRYLKLKKDFETDVQDMDGDESYKKGQKDLADSNFL